MPFTDRECQYHKFKELTLRSSEDPILFLWRMKECLRKAEPDLSDYGFDALLRRQLMRSLPSHLKPKLLESNPTPILEDMVSFAQRFRALWDLPCAQSDVSACTASPGDAPPHAGLLVDTSKHNAWQQNKEKEIDKLQTTLDVVVAQIAVLRVP